MIGPSLKKDIIPNSIYLCIDFTKCLIGGSYALSLYDNSTWDASDIDIYVKIENPPNKTESMKEFKEIVDDFISKSSSTIERDYMSQDEIIKKNEGVKDLFEHFDKQIIGTIILKNIKVPKKIEFIGIYCGEDSLKDYLEKITDVPSCISYSIDMSNLTEIQYKGLLKQFNVPKKFKRENINSNLICNKRKEKYQERGYTFE